MAKTKVGIVGFGKLGQFIADKILNDPVVSCKLELVWVWNRSSAAFESDEGVNHAYLLCTAVLLFNSTIYWASGKALPEGSVLESLDNFAERPVDLIVEVNLTYQRYDAPTIVNKIIIDTTAIRG